MDIQQNVSLKNHTTFKIGGAAKYFCRVEKIEDLQEALNFAGQEKLKVFVLGGGSNVLFSDDGFDGLVIKIGNRDFEVVEEGERGVVIKCGAGTLLPELVKFCMEKGYSGMEWAAGIPGTVGGALRGNAGAFGSSMSDSVERVRALKIGQKELEEISFDKKDCQFDYRASVFKKNQDLFAWSVEMRLEKGDGSEIGEKVKEYLRRRQEKQPALGKFPSVGSVFKNSRAPEKVLKKFEEDKEIKVKDDKVPSGWLIESCGLKGKQIGGAMVSRKHADFIVNTGEATSEDVMILISLIKQKVRNRFGIQLEEEIQIVL